MTVNNDFLKENKLESDLNTDLVILQSHLEGMLDRAKSNSISLHKFQSFEMRLLKLNSLAEMIDLLLNDARDYFDLDIVSLCVVDEKGEIAKLLQEDGYDYTSKKGLILLDDKNRLLAKIGLVIHSYIGAYKYGKYADFFADFGPKPASIAITPLNRRGKYLGTLNLGSHQIERFSDTMATDFVDHLASIVSICLENNLNFETIKRTSYVDGLTGINNRRFFEQRIVEELDRCRRNTEPLSCLFLDIDFFKAINDKHGHQAGDQVLFEVASAIKTQLRGNDVLARYGGEEFIILLSNINETMAPEIAERVRQTIQSLPIKWEQTPIPVTVSIGSSTYLPCQNTTTSVQANVSERLIKIADAALYQAKRNGRNRIANGGIVSEKPRSGSVAVVNQ